MLYGAPIWTPSTSVIKVLTNAATPPQVIQNIIPKISRTVAEKVHLTFLKWLLGVHRKSSNIGTWGEIGRYPLIYQAIKLTLKYYYRLTKINPKSFVYAALSEQKLLNLPWFKNIESLLKIDNVYNDDHVTAYKNINYNSNACLLPKQSRNNISSASKELLTNLSSLSKIKPLPSKRFRSYTIIKCLTNHFKSCWENNKSAQSKLTFYHASKASFGKEPYLDSISNAEHRYQTTRLRISAHDLEIERGRYCNTPREDRICKWCLLTMDNSFIEDEAHMLHYCDLYADAREKMIRALKRAPCETDTRCTITSNITHITLDEAFMKLLSPHTTSNEDEHNKVLTQHHVPLNLNADNLNHQLHLQLRSYIIKCVCAYVSKCFEIRKKFVTTSTSANSNSCVTTTTVKKSKLKLNANVKSTVFVLAR